EVPPVMATDTLRVPGAAAASTMRSAVNERSPATARLARATPTPLTTTVVPPGTNPVPVSVTDVVPGVGRSGSTPDSVGGGGTTTNGRGPLSPAAVDTVTLRSPSAASAPIAKLAVSKVASVTLTPLTV